MPDPGARQGDHEGVAGVVVADLADKLDRPLSSGSGSGDLTGEARDRAGRGSGIAPKNRTAQDDDHG